MLPDRCRFMGPVLVTALLPAASLGAQASESPIFGLGYTASAPHMLLGGSAWAVFPALRGFGLYVDAKFTHDSPANNEEEFLPGRTAQEMEEEHPLHLFRVEDDAYRAFNGALMKTITPELTLYAGGGWVERTRYLQYYDEQEEFGRLGFYWVEDPPASGTGVNVMGGALLRLGRNLRVQFGGETRPKGFTVGLSINIPGR